MRYSIYYPINNQWYENYILIIDNHKNKVVLSSIKYVSEATAHYGWTFSDGREGDDNIHLLDTDDLLTVKLSLETIKEDHPELFI